MKFPAAKIAYVIILCSFGTIKKNRLFLQQYYVYITFVPNKKSLINLNQTTRFDI